MKTTKIEIEHGIDRPVTRTYYYEISIFGSENVVKEKCFYPLNPTRSKVYIYIYNRIKHFRIKGKCKGSIHNRLLRK